MGNIKFSETEKQALVQFHQLELKKAIETVEQIKERIRTLAGKSKTGGPKGAKNIALRTHTVKPKRVRRTKAQLAAAAKQITLHRHKATSSKQAKTKTPQRIKWKTFVPQILKQKRAPMTTREILNIAAKKFNISVERKKMKSLSQILRNMKKAGHITAEEIKGSKQKIKQYSLVS